LAQYGSDQSATWRVSVTLWVLAAIAVGLNLPAMVRGIREILIPERDNGAA
jgi:hypothetical protein